MFTYTDWQILYFILVIIILFAWKEIWRSNIKYLLLLLSLNLALVIYAFTDPGTYAYLVDGTLVERLMMYHAPIALFILSILAAHIISSEPAGK